MRYLLIRAMAIGVIGTFSIAGSSAWAQCACFCLDGELRTMCTTVEEAQDGVALCGAYQRMDCPTDPAAAEGASYGAPADGAVNCRDLRVYDALQGAFTTIKACDVEAS